MKKISTLAIFCIAVQAVAQPQERPGEAKKEQVEAMKVAFITRRVGLTPAEAQTFWPVYNQFEAEQDLMRKNHRTEKKAASEDMAKLPDTEIEKLVDGEIIFRQQELDLVKKYHAQFKRLLPIKKVALLYKAQEDFKRELLKKIQEKAARRAPMNGDGTE